MRSVGPILFLVSAGIGCHSSAIRVGAKDGSSANDVFEGDTSAPGPQILAGDQHYPAVIATDQLNVYWYSLGTTSCDITRPSPWTQGQVAKCPKTGCRAAATVLAADRTANPSGTPVTDLVSDGEYVYWNDETGSSSDSVGPSQALWACSVSGCGNNPQALYAGTVSWMAAWGKHLYWTAAGSVVEQCVIPGCASPSPVASASDANSITGALAVDDSGVYWTVQDGTILKCPTEGCSSEPAVVKSSTEEFPQQIALDAQAIYYLGTYASAGEPAGVFVCPKNGCGSTPVVLVSGVNHPTSIATDGVNVYWTESGLNSGAVQQPGTGGVRKCAVAGCNNAPTTVASGLKNPQGMAVDDRNVYWAESGTCPDFNGNVWWAPK